MNISSPKNCHSLTAVSASKSYMHRLLISAALSKGEQSIGFNGAFLSGDIDATIECLRELGCDCVIGEYSIAVGEICVDTSKIYHLDCRSSGTTLRFMLCLCAGLGITAELSVSEQLSKRPNTGLTDLLNAGGCRVTRSESSYYITGQLASHELTLENCISSQYVSGLLFALPLIGGGKLSVTNLESVPYVEMTAEVLRKAGIQVDVLRDCNSYTFTVCGEYSFSDCMCEGDWSQAVWLLCSGALNGGVSVAGLNPQSIQGDRHVLSLLESFGAFVNVTADCIAVSPGSRKPITADMSNYPDMVPPVAVMLAFAAGESRLSGCERLRYKECDRLFAIIELINNLGGSARYEEDVLIISGGGLHGGYVDVHDDHRLIMSAVVAAVGSCECVLIDAADAVFKSDPLFFTQLHDLGLIFTED